MNTRRGYLRLSIAVVGAWISVWTAVGVYAARKRDWWDEFADSLLADVLSNPSSPTRQLSEEWILAARERQGEYDALASDALTWGLMSIPLALVFAVGWWVYRGFASRS